MIDKFLQYLEFEKLYSSLTILSYKRDLDDLKYFLLESEGLSDITNADKKQLRNFIISLSKKNLSEKTINRKISTLRSYYKFLLKVEKISISPVTNLKNLKIKKKVLLPYTEEEIKFLHHNITDENNEKLTDFERSRNLLIFDFFYLTGIRRIELINLEVSKINIPDKNISIIGKRNKERLVPITNELIEKIKTYMLLRENEILTVSQYFFTDKSGKRLQEKFVYNLINKYLSSATSKNKKSPHMLRHTFASHLLNNGAELNSIKEILGHSSLAATQIYTHSNIDDLKQVFNHSHPLGLKNKKNEN
ncbi:tyrosine-type recombinase/integrase [Apibacter raozihei]|uniref:tyrosine-type recombinase/integrase n=1 Tax=Apibacter TaxID=1778601 RepID=UPI000FE30C40|nr:MULTISPECIES: tyrosine-type recombinase/integrase [Apibacter]